VGEDQEQHLELCREIAERFNRKFKDIFPVAKRLPGEAPRILGLDGKQKMSKSLGNHIGVLDAPEVIQKKLAGAFTDPNRIRKSDPGDPDKCNVFSLHGFFTPEEERAGLADGCRQGTIGCFDCKKVLAGTIDGELGPIRARAETLRNRPETVREALEAGSERCRAIAARTMAEVRDAMGIGTKSLTAYAK
jgi:tryptophanyl-tRNA synthetase